MGLFRRAFENSSSTGLLTQGFLLQRRRKVFKTGSAIASGFILEGVVLSKLFSKSVQKWWCHGTTGTTAYDGTVYKVVFSIYKTVLSKTLCQKRTLYV